MDDLALLQSEQQRMKKGEEGVDSSSMVIDSKVELVFLAWSSSFSRVERVVGGRVEVEVDEEV